MPEDRAEQSVEGRPLDEPQLIERARLGEVSAYEELVRRYQAIAHRTAFLIAGAADADDAAQTAFVKAYYAMGRFRPGAPFRPWILRIVANEARNRRKSAGRRAALDLRLAGDRRPEEAAPSPEAAVLASEPRREILAALRRVSEADRDVIACRYLLDLSEIETAEVLGVARGTVKSRLSRALTRLREHLPPREDEP
jgi:RNA polymerase sigma-70 factor (ECF subfamily)